MGIGKLAVLAEVLPIVGALHKVIAQFSTLVCPGVKAA